MIPRRRKKLLCFCPVFQGKYNYMGLRGIVSSLTGFDAKTRILGCLFVNSFSRRWLSKRVFKALSAGYRVHARPAVVAGAAVQTLTSLRSAVHVCGDFLYTSVLTAADAVSLAKTYVECGLLYLSGSNGRYQVSTLSV
jgi:hypothetical protein